MTQFGLSGKDIPHEEGRVYSSNVMGDLMSAMVSEVNANDLPSFKAYLDGSQEIADRLFVSVKTVNTYRYRIFEKLGIDSDVKLDGVKVGEVEVDPLVASISYVWKF